MILTWIIVVSHYFDSNDYRPVPTTCNRSVFLVSTKDMLENLVPLEVHNAMVDYESKKGGLVQAEVGRMREATQLMNG